MHKLRSKVRTVFLKSVLYSKNNINNSMRMLILTLPFIFLTSCSPTKCPLSSLPKEDRERYNTEETTKYPDVPTMQAAEDASTGKLFKD